MLMQITQMLIFWFLDLFLLFFKFEAQRIQKKSKLSWTFNRGGFVSV